MSDLLSSTGFTDLNLAGQALAALLALIVSAAAGIVSAHAVAGTALGVWRGGRVSAQAARGAGRLGKRALARGRAWLRGDPLALLPLGPLYHSIASRLMIDKQTGSSTVWDLDAFPEGADCALVCAARRLAVGFRGGAPVLYRCADADATGRLNARERAELDRLAALRLDTVLAREIAAP